MIQHDFDNETGTLIRYGVGLLVSIAVSGPVKPYFRIGLIGGPPPLCSELRENPTRFRDTLHVNFVRSQFHFRHHANPSSAMTSLFRKWFGEDRPVLRGHRMQSIVLTRAELVEIRYPCESHQPRESANE